MQLNMHAWGTSERRSLLIFMFTSKYVLSTRYTVYCFTAAASGLNIISLSMFAFSPLLIFLT